MKFLTGHADAKREYTDAGCGYADSVNTGLAIFCAMRCASLPDLDTFIERMESEGEGAGIELRARRQKAYAAFANGLKMDVVIRHLEWIASRARELTNGEFLIPHARRGLNVLSGAKRGHELTHGCADEKQKKYIQYQEEVDRLHEKKPTLSYEGIKKSVAKKFSVSSKTIQRHTTNPTKKQGHS